MDQKIRDDQLIITMGNTVAKVTFYVAMAVISCFWISSCELNEEIIRTCEDSCETFGSHMQSVTTRECECADIQPIRENDPGSLYVLPSR
jgi:hypothetical protein